MMKKLLSGLFIALCSSAAFGQVKTTKVIPNTIIKFSPQHLVRGGLWLSAELQNNEHRAGHQFSLEFMYRQPNSGYNDYGIYEATGFTGEYMAKYYLNRMHVEKSLGRERVGGYYAAVFAQFGSYNEKVKYYSYDNNVWPPVQRDVNNTIKTSAIYPGFVFGKQMSLGEGFFIDMHLGAGIRKVDVSLATADPDYKFNDSPDGFFIDFGGLLPKAGFSLGFGF